MSGAQLTHARDRLVGVERRGGLEGILRELEIHFGRLHSGIDQRIQREVVGRRILRQHQRLAAKIGDRLDVLANHDAVAAIGPIHLLIDPRHHARILPQALEKQRNHVERAPADVHVAGGVGVAHRDRIVDQRQFDFEILAAGSLPDFARLEAVIGEDDGRPSGPHVHREPHRAVGHGLVVGDALHRRELLRRDVVVFLGGGDALAVGRFRRFAPVLLRDRRRLCRCRAARRSATTRARPAPPRPQNCQVESWFRISVSHDVVLSSTDITPTMPLQFAKTRYQIMCWSVSVVLSWSRRAPDPWPTPALWWSPAIASPVRPQTA